jgi:hypothetical protein
LVCGSSEDTLIIAPPPLFFYQLDAPGDTSTKKLIVLRWWAGHGEPLELDVV